MKYWITTYFGQTPQTYPSGNVSKPRDWNFDQSIAYQTNVVSSKKPIELFDAHVHVERLNRVWLPDSKLVLGQEKGKDYLYLNIKELIKTDPENLNGPKIADYSMRHYAGDLIKGRRRDLSLMKNLAIDGYTPSKTKCPVQFSLIMKDGTAFGSIIKLNAKKRRYNIRLDKMHLVSSAILPRPYPTFLPYYSNVIKTETLNLSQIESLHISIGPGMKQSETSQAHEVMIGRVWLE